MSSKDILKTAYEAISDKKGENTRIIDISKVSVIADYFIVTNGSNVKLVSTNSTSPAFCRMSLIPTFRAWARSRAMSIRFRLLPTVWKRNFSKPVSN